MPNAAIHITVRLFRSLAALLWHELTLHLPHRRIDPLPLVPLTEAQCIANARRIVRDFAHYAAGLGLEDQVELFRSAKDVLRSAETRAPFQREFPEDAA